jgi:hypothetical protein
LLRDNNWFRAVTVAMGCVGVFYFSQFEVAPAYLVGGLHTVSI